MKRNNGFTIIEIMIALVASVILIGGVLSIYLMSLRTWREGSMDAALERTAGIIMEKIVRGPYGRFGIREADIGTVDVSESGNAVVFMVDKNDPPTPEISDDVTSRYYQAGTQAIYDPNTAVVGDETVLNRFGDVNQLGFSLRDQVLTADLVITADAPRSDTRKLVARMRTDIFFRKRK